MSKQEAAFFELLRCGLWERGITDLSLFPLTKEQWKWVYWQSLRQTVQGVLFRGFQYLPEEMFPPEQIMLRWLVEINRIENRNLRTQDVIIELNLRFSKDGLMPVLQKGLGIAMMYEHPELRVCGDIDFFFYDMKKFKQLKESLKEDGVDIHAQADGGYVYYWEGIQVEHHHHFIDLRNPFVNGYLKKLEEKLQHTKFFVSDSLSARIPEPSLNLLMLNTHIMKHAFILGIGLRQFCDMARAYYTYSSTGKLEGNEVKEMYKKAGIEKWSRLLHSFLVKYIGLPKEYLPYDEAEENCEELLASVMKCGNFGQHVLGWEKASHSLIARKIYTFRMMYHNRKISFRYAPFETISKFVHLLLGQANE